MSACLLAVLAALAAAGQEPPAAPPVQGAPVALTCTMTITYRETITQLPILPVIRLWKELDGIAKVVCPGEEPVRLRVRASGLSLGVGIPTDSPFSSTNEGIAASLDILVPLPFARRNFEGEYVNVGAEVGGVGASLSPWTNRDRSLNMTIYLPASFNASAAINLQTLELHLLDSGVDW